MARENKKAKGSFKKEQEYRVYYVSPGNKRIEVGTTTASNKSDAKEKLKHLAPSGVALVAEKAKTLEL